MKKLNTITLEGFIEAFKNSNSSEDYSDNGLTAMFNELTYMNQHYYNYDMDMDVISFALEYKEDSESEVLDTHNVGELASLQECTFAIKLDNGNVLYRVV